MKFKTIAVIAACVVVAAFCLLRSCRSDAAYRQAKLEYEGYKAIAEADNQMSRQAIDQLQGHIDSLTTTIAQRDQTIEAQKQAIASNRLDIKNKDAEVAALRQEVQPVLDQNPKVAELVASLDAAIVLRDHLIASQESQIATLTERVSLADQRYQAQVGVTAEWKAMYEREAKLRVLGEGLISDLERQVRGLRLRGKLATTALAVAGGVIAYSLVK